MKHKIKLIIISNETQALKPVAPDGFKSALLHCTILGGRIIVVVVVVVVIVAFRLTKNGHQVSPMPTLLRLRC